MEALDVPAFLVERRGVGGDRAASAEEQPGARRVDDRRVISGILHVDDRRVISGILHVFQDWLPLAGLPARVWSAYDDLQPVQPMVGRLIWRNILEALVTAGVLTHPTAIDSTYVKVHRSAHGGKGGRGRRRSASRAADRPLKSTF